MCSKVICLGSLFDNSNKNILQKGGTYKNIQHKTITTIWIRAHMEQWEHCYGQNKNEFSHGNARDSLIALYSFFSSQFFQCACQGRG